MASEVRERLAVDAVHFENLMGQAREGVYLYGAGFIGRWAVDYLEGLGIPVLGFIDSNTKRRGESFAGKNIYAPKDPNVLTAAVILISSRHAVGAVKSNLAGLPASVMSVDEFVVHHRGLEAINQIENLFSGDLRSIETYRAVLLSMLTGTTKPLSNIANSQPFFHRFGFFNRSDEIFVDAGAFVGDSLERFIWSVNGVFKEIHAFEPSRPQFEALQNRVLRLSVEWALASDRIFLVNRGVSDKSREVVLHSGSHLIQSRITPFDPSTESATFDGEIVKTIGLDEYFGESGYSLLKVDIEGSELELLNGATRTIASCRPRIALSIYHYPTDIFVLPLRCKEINPDYEFSLGHHSSQLMDTVLYCRDLND